MDECICNTCKHHDKDLDEKPCSVCMQWVDGYLDATQFDPQESY